MQSNYHLSIALLTPLESDYLQSRYGEIYIWLAQLTKSSGSQQLRKTYCQLQLEVSRKKFKCNTVWISLCCTAMFISFSAQFLYVIDGFTCIIQGTSTTASYCNAIKSVWHVSYLSGLRIFNMWTELQRSFPTLKVLFLFSRRRTLSMM